MQKNLNEMQINISYQCDESTQQANITLNSTNRSASTMREVLILSCSAQVTFQVEYHVWFHV